MGRRGSSAPKGFSLATSDSMVKQRFPAEGNIISRQTRSPSGSVAPRSCSEGCGGSQRGVMAAGGAVLRRVWVRVRVRLPPSGAEILQKSATPRNCANPQRLCALTRFPCASGREVKAPPASAVSRAAADWSRAAANQPPRVTCSTGAPRKRGRANE